VHTQQLILVLIPVDLWWTCLAFVCSRRKRSQGLRHHRYNGCQYYARHAVPVLHTAETCISFLFLGISLGALRYRMVSCVLSCDDNHTDFAQVETARRCSSSSAQRSSIFRLDFARCWSRIVGRHNGNRHAHVQKHSSMDTAQSSMDATRRVTMVPPTSCIRYAVLYYSPYRRSLC
jgi:hypothetical protein